jgi:hypothetical protein
LTKHWWQPPFHITAGALVALVALGVSIFWEPRRAALFVCVAAIVIVCHCLCWPTSEKEADPELLLSDRIEPTLVLETETLNGYVPFGGFAQFLYYKVIGMRHDEDWLYQRGYEDGKKLLVPKLRNFGVRDKPSDQTCSSKIDLRISKLPTFFDRGRQQFTQNL